MGVRPTIISLFTGYGGLEMGLDRALGGARAVCMVEREAFAIANLVAQMEACAVAPTPIWTDVRTFDGKPWRDRVDILWNRTHRVRLLGNGVCPAQAALAFRELSSRALV